VDIEQMLSRLTKVISWRPESAGGFTALLLIEESVNWP